VRRSRRQAPHENHERWLVSYADFITLLFAFFTTLYAISVVDANKAQRLVHSIRESFGDTRPREAGGGLFEFPRGQRTSALEGDEDPVTFEAARFEELEQAVDGLAEKGVVEGVGVQRSREGLVIRLADSHFFEPGRAGLSDAARIEIARIAGLLRPLWNQIRVEGHTDDRPLRSGAYRSNWELSAARAVAVVEALAGSGISASRLSAAGFADQRPVVSNETDEGRRINRRVDLVVLSARVSLEDLAPAGGKPR
jgi:chemotaxis protein MotB